MSADLWGQYLAIRPVAPVAELAAATGWEPGEFKIRLEEGWETVEGVVSPDRVWGIRDEAPLPSLAGRQLTYIKTGYRVSAVPFLTDSDCMELAALLQASLELDDFQTASELYRAWYDEHWPEKKRTMDTMLLLGGLALSTSTGPTRPPDDVIKQIPSLGSLFKLEWGDR